MEQREHAAALQKKGDFLMDPRIKMGITVAQKGMKVVQIGKKALNIKKKLPGEREKTLRKAEAKQEKRNLRAEKKALRSIQRKKTVRGGKRLGKTAFSLWDRFF